uniref:Uncharacterized protein n=1 Tax=Cacopsylla melanoneura TaxID=428564 RepID=A0A8D8UJU0_9HEMI
MLRQCWSLSHYHLPFTKLKELDLSVRILESTVKRMFLYTYTSFWAHNKTVPTSIYLLILLSILDLGKGEKKKEKNSYGGGGRVVDEAHFLVQTSLDLRGLELFKQVRQLFYLKKRLRFI